LLTHSVYVNTSLNNSLRYLTSILQASGERDRPLCRQRHLTNMFYVTDPEV